MAKGQQRSNREQKKPKKVKPKVTATAGTSTGALAKHSSSARDKK